MVFYNLDVTSVFNEPLNMNFSGLFKVSPFPIYLETSNESILKIRDYNNSLSMQALFFGTLSG